MEFALILPVILLLTFAIIEFGIAAFSYSSVANAAREGARYGAVAATPPRSDDDIKEYAYSHSPGLSSDRSRLIIEVNPDGPDPDKVTVEVKYRVDFMAGDVIEALGMDSVWLSSTAVMQREVTQS